MPVSSLVVEVMTHDGRSGFGEALCPVAPRAAAAVINDVFAPLLVDQDETCIERHWHAMHQAIGTRASGAGGEAISAIDIALWDLLGQALGRPIHTLLGGFGRRRVLAYGSFIAWVSDAEAIAQAERAIALGFRQLKVKLLPPLDAALARVTLIRKIAGPNIRLVADPNGTFDFVEALRLANHLADIDYAWLEEPVDPADHMSLARLNTLGVVRIAAGENEFSPRGAIGLVRDGVVSLLQPDCGRVGGITGFCTAARAAAALGVPFAPHHAGGAIKAAAALHLCAALPGFEIMECSLLRTALHDDFTLEPVAHPAQLDGDGTLPVPTDPGLGVTVNRDTLRRIGIT
jgi:L-alanine-DL-glutamate epimerase-like enolase superfamily enzyme